MQHKVRVGHLHAKQRFDILFSMNRFAAANRSKKRHKALNVATTYELVPLGSWAAVELLGCRKLLWLQYYHRQLPEETLTWLFPSTPHPCHPSRRSRPAQWTARGPRDQHPPLCPGWTGPAGTACLTKWEHAKEEWEVSWRTVVLSRLSQTRATFCQYRPFITPPGDTHTHQRCAKSRKSELTSSHFMSHTLNSASKRRGIT